ncbi:probable L-type lectin-domain containing receptor kinase S.5 [Triticum aestivum]|uniref:probable L-type lectin-domain containing receptor kinase S.5 n=1 Tax=Triticum aestivum TaxID=4565 RepID=UPI001D00C1A2|nr:probable L-type lectin-domain containing receptor kinase S.5 [Triticum aestivum]
MAFQLKLLPFPVLLLLSTISFSHASEQPCKCPCSDQDRRSNHSLHAAALALQMIDQESGGLVPVDFDFIRHNLSDSEANSIPGFTIIDGVELWQLRPDGVGVDEASFNVTIGYHPLSNQQERQNEAYGGPTFFILPDEGTLDLGVAPYGANSSLAKLLVENGSANSITNRTTRAAIVSGSSSVYVGTGVLANRSLTGFTDPIMVVAMNIHEMPAFSPNYTMWIDYDRAGRRLSVYVDLQGKPKPENTIAEVHLNISSILSSRVYFSFVTMIGQLLPGGGLNYIATIEDLPRYDPDPDEGRFLSRKVTILSSVIGSIAVTAVLATAVACYFNSRYRRWHRDLDQLAKSMERLPGVPTKVEFADIKKATSNFHEAMKLGGGGFGTVYRCTLPAAASKTERPMDVAVKRFTRDVQNRCYDDFIAEVSNINRLRHKNIVPLVGKPKSLNHAVAALRHHSLVEGAALKYPAHRTRLRLSEVVIQQRRAPVGVRVHDQRQFRPTSLPQRGQRQRQSLVENRA